MSYVNKTLLKNETIKKLAKLHKIMFVPGVLLTLLLPGIGLILLLVEFIKYKTTEFAITNKRIITKVGFISRNTVELNLNKVESLSINQSITGRLLDYGTVTVHGTGGVKVPLKYIAKPLELRKAFNEATI